MIPDWVPNKTKNTSQIPLHETVKHLFQRDSADLCIALISATGNQIPNTPVIAKEKARVSYALKSM